MRELKEKQQNHVKAKAKHVANYLEIYYAYIEEYQNIHFEEYQPVDGEWNPIQIMRNRRIRSKKDQKLKNLVSEGICNEIKFEDGLCRRYQGTESLDFKSHDWQRVKLASRVFSKFSMARNIWQINLHEIIGDIYWRNDEWDELKDANGKLWFPKEDSDQSLSASSLIKSVPFVSTSDSRVESTHNLILAKEHAHTNSNGSEPTRGAKEEVQLLVNNKDTAAAARNKLGKELKEEDKGKDEEDDDDEDEGIMNNSEVEGSAHPTTSTSISETPLTDYGVDDGEYIEEFASKIKMMEVTILSKGRDIDLFKYGVLDSVDSLTAKLKKQMDKYKVLERECEVRCTKLNSELDIIDSQLTTHQSMINERENKIEELLGYCDRTNGDINTSITLSIRNLMERTSNIGDEIEVSIFTEFGYKAVESLIVALMWVFWMFVEAWLLLRWSALKLFKIVKWVLF